MKTPIFVRIKSKEVKENPLPKRENSKSGNKLNKMPAIINKKIASSEKLKQVNPSLHENLNMVYEWNKKNAETQTEEIFFKMLYIYKAGLGHTLRKGTLRSILVGLKGELIIVKNY